MADLTLRNVKGSPLTNQEVDDNFSNLNTDKYESGDSATFSDVTLSGMVGSISWNSVDGALDVPLDADVTLQVGQEFVFYAKATGAIANGDAVMFAGAQGNHALIKKCDMASVGFDPTYIVGVATQAFANNEFGYVTSIGKVRGLNTSAYAEGTILYVSPTVAGALTSTNPSGTGHVVQAAAVLRSHATQGVILVRLTHISELGELDGVAITNVSTGQYLTYNGSSWVNTTLDTTNWDTAYGWGNHASVGYLTSIPSEYLTETEGDARYLSINATTLPDQTGHAGQFLTTNGTTADWATVDTSLGDTAYGWGNHASVGYLTSASLTGYATETYVNTAVSNLVDSAPATLDTLNELAAALGDDPNFATTVSNSIGTKWTQDNTKISNWDTAYSWGNHATAGYLTSVSGYLPLTGGTLTGGLTVDGAATIDGGATYNTVLTLDSGTANTYLKITDSNSTNGTFIGATTNDLNFYPNNSLAVTMTAAGNVGIGGSTITDSNLLNIQGSGASKNIGVVFNDTNTSKIFSIQNGGSALKFFDYTASAERMRIDSSGNVGIGVVPPSSQVSYIRNVQIAALQAYGHTSVNDWGGFFTNSYIDAAGVRKYISSSQYAHNLHFDNNGAFIFYNAPNTNLAGDTVPFAERMRIDSSGKVLVGGTAQADATSVTLNPEGYIYAKSSHQPAAFFDRDNSDGDIVTLRKDGTAVGSIGVTGANAYINSQGGTFKISTVGTERYNFDLEQIYPSVDNDTNLGLSSKRFKNLYLSGTVTATGGNSTNWNTAYGWGDHAAAGYITSATGFLPLTGGTLTGSLFGTTATFSGIITSGTGVSGGIQNATYTGGRNRIWSFGNADGYGISYFQGGPDYIGFHFGTASEAGSQLLIRNDGQIILNGTAIIDSSRNLTNIGTISSGAQTLVASATVVQSLRNPSTSWGEYALTRYGTEAANFRYMDFGYYRGTTEATRGLVIKSQAFATLFTFLDSGEFQIGTTTVIDSSRNISNINAISIGQDISGMDTANLDLDIVNNASIRGSSALYFGVTTNNYNSWKTRISSDNTSTMSISGAATSINGFGYNADVYGLFNTSGLQILGNTAWHAGNDGSGSGLDADLLDGVSWENAPSIKSTGLISADNRQVMAVAHWSASGGSTGAIVIELPGTTNTYSMPVIEITTFEYTGAGHTTYTISGHNWQTASFWYNSKCTVVGAAGKGIYLGYNSNTNRHCIQIGVASTGWSYGAVTVAVKHHPSYYDSAQDMAGSWNIFQTTNLAGINTGGVSTDVVWHTANDGSGSGLDADLLDGQQGSYYAPNSSLGNYLPLTGGTLSGNLITSGSGNYVVIGGAAANNAYDTVPATTGLTFGGGNDFNNYSIGTSSQNIGGNYTKLNIKWHTGIRLFSMPQYGGVRFYSDVAMNTETFSINYLDGHVRVANNLYANGGNLVWNGSNDGSGSGLDADLLDGIDSTYFNRGDQGYGVMVGTSGWNMDDLFTNRNRAGFFDVWSGSNFPPSTSHVHGMQVRHNSSAHYGWQLAGQYGQNTLWHRQVSNNSWGSWNQQWGSGNDGSGSGLDADLLDGYNASLYADANTVAVRDSNGHLTANYILGSYFNASNGNSENPTIGQIWTQSTGDNYLRKSTPAHFRNSMMAVGLVGGTSGKGTTNAAFGSTANSDSGFYDVHNNGTPTGTWYSMINMAHYGGNHGHQIAGSFYSEGDLYNRNNSNTSLSAWAKIWNTANDGSGSGLDADLLDGQQGSYYAPLASPTFTGTLVSPIIQARKSQEQGNYTTAALWTESYSSTNTGIAFHINGNVGKMLDMRTDGHLYWENGRVWSATSDGSGSGLDADLLDGYNSDNFLGKFGSGYYQANNWTQLTGGNGLYCPQINDAHFTPNASGTYGTWRIIGSRSGYTGIYLDHGGVNTAMYDSGGNGGEYHPSFGWYTYFSRGNGCMGIAGSSTSASYGLYESGGGIYSTGNITAYSDRRVKENIRTIDNALETVEQMRGVYYNRIDDEEKKTVIGFIAQEVDEVEGAKPLVTYAADVDQYGVSYGNATALLVEAIKELSQQVKELQQEIKELKNA